MSNLSSEIEDAIGRRGRIAVEAIYILTASVSVYFALGHDNEIATFLATALLAAPIIMLALRTISGENAE